jgi:hypothetical protein
MWQGLGQSVGSALGEYGQSKGGWGGGFGNPWGGGGWGGFSYDWNTGQYKKA